MEMGRKKRWILRAASTSGERHLLLLHTYFPFTLHEDVEVLIIHIAAPIRALDGIGVRSAIASIGFVGKRGSIRILF
jgi:hypothetical protein